MIWFSLRMMAVFLPFQYQIIISIILSNPKFKPCSPINPANLSTHPASSTPWASSIITDHTKARSRQPAIILINVKDILTFPHFCFQFTRKHQPDSSNCPHLFYSLMSSRETGIPNIRPATSVQSNLRIRNN